MARTSSLVNSRGLPFKQARVAMAYSHTSHSENKETAQNSKLIFRSYKNLARESMAKEFNWNLFDRIKSGRAGCVVNFYFQPKSIFFLYVLPVNCGVWLLRYCVNRLGIVKHDSVHVSFYPQQSFAGDKFLTLNETPKIVYVAEAKVELKFQPWIEHFGRRWRERMKKGT